MISELPVSRSGRSFTNDAPPRGHPACFRPIGRKWKLWTAGAPAGSGDQPKAESITPKRSVLAMTPETRCAPGPCAATRTSSPVWLVPTATDGFSSVSVLFLATFGAAGSRRSAPFLPLRTRKSKEWSAVNSTSVLPAICFAVFWTRRSNLAAVSRHRSGFDGCRSHSTIRKKPLGLRDKISIALAVAASTSKLSSSSRATRRLAPAGIALYESAKVRPLAANSLGRSMPSSLVDSRIFLRPLPKTISTPSP